MANLAVLEGDGVDISIERPIQFGTFALLGKRGFLRRRAHSALNVARGAGHGIAQAGRFARRKAKQAVRSIASKLLFHGYGSLMGEAGAPTMTKNAAKAALAAPSTAALLAFTVTAPFAPAAPVLVNEVVDEIYSTIEKKIKKGATPQQAAAETQVHLQNNDDKALGAGFSMPVLLGGAAAVGVLYFLFLKRKR